MEQDNSTNKELIALAKEELKKAKPKYVDYKMEAIIKDMGLIPGETQALGAVLYYIYTKMYSNPEKPRRFFRYLKNNFKYKSYCSEIYYFINGEGFDLSVVSLFNARQLMSKHYGKTKKNK